MVGTHVMGPCLQSAIGRHRSTVASCGLAVLLTQNLTTQAMQSGVSANQNKLGRRGIEGENCCFDGTVYIFKVQ